MIAQFESGACEAIWMTLMDVGLLDRDRFCLLRRLGLNVTHFLDIGGDMGEWSDVVSKEFPDARFDLFEPLVDHIPQYEGLMKSRLATHKNFHLHKVALGNRTDQVTMRVFSNFVGSTALTMDYPPSDTREVQVPMFTLDDYLERNRIPVPQAVKIDTQGSELSILEGAEKTLPKVQVFLCECWLSREYGKATPLIHELMSWFAKRRFFLWDLGIVYREKNGTLISQDCFFLNADCAISRMKVEPVGELRNGP